MKKQDIKQKRFTMTKTTEQTAFELFLDVNESESLMTLDDIPEYEMISDDDIKEAELVLTKKARAKRLKVIKSSPYFSKCNLCKREWIAMSEKYMEKCPFCKTK